MPECWIWDHQGTIHWLTPDARGCFQEALPGPAEYIDSLADLRVRRTEVDLRQGLYPDVHDLLDDQLQRGEPVVVHLLANLPEGWQRFPYEWLQWRGRFLHGKLVVVRHAPASIWQVPPTVVSGEAVLFDLWTEADARSPAAGPFRGLGGLHGLNVLRGLGPVTAFLKHRNLGALALLAIASHGSELCGQSPFRLREGCLWELPWDEPMPPVILLLVCGNDRYNLLDYATRLMDRGASAVIAPTGQLDATAASGFLRDFLRRRESGERLDALLAASQREDISGLGARRLLLIGNGALRLCTAPTSSSSGKNGFTSSEQMAEFCNRTTLRAALEDAGQDRVIDWLYVGTGTDPLDPASERGLLESADAALPRCWSLTTAWLLPHLAYLADKYDHSRLETYEVLHRALRSSPPRTAYGQFGWAKLYYRHGHVLAAMNELVEGLRLLDPASPCDEGGAALMGHLVNALIDLNLPRTGQWVFDRLDACLAGKGDSLQDRYRSHRLDRAARLAVRQGQVAKALTFYRLRHAEAMHEGLNGARELSWLLYLHAWNGTPTSEIVDAVLALLPLRTPDCLDTTSTNDSEGYLLRALAAWAWRAGDADLTAWLNHWTDVLIQRSCSQDPDPYAQALAFIHLLARRLGTDHADLPDWGVVQALLESRHQWLDEALLDWLAGYMEDCSRALARFQAMRRDQLRALTRLPGWLGLADTTGWEAEIDLREHQERSALANAPGDNPWAVLAPLGLVPI